MINFIPLRFDGTLGVARARFAARSGSGTLTYLHVIQYLPIRIYT